MKNLVGFWKFNERYTETNPGFLKIIVTTCTELRVGSIKVRVRSGHVYPTFLIVVTEKCS